MINGSLSLCLRLKRDVPSWAFLHLQGQIAAEACDSDLASVNPDGLAEQTAVILGNKYRLERRDPLMPFRLPAR